MVLLAFTNSVVIPRLLCILCRRGATKVLSMGSRQVGWLGWQYALTYNRWVLTDADAPCLNKLKIIR